MRGRRGETGYNFFLNVSLRFQRMVLLYFFNHLTGVRYVLALSPNSPHLTVPSDRVDRDSGGELGRRA